MVKLFIVLSVLLCCERAAASAAAATVHIYSSFWAPLFDPSILNYRVDVSFEPQAARSAREHFTNKYGYRGEKLIADLGNGIAPRIPETDPNKIYGDVKFSYT